MLLTSAWSLVSVDGPNKFYNIAVGHTGYILHTISTGLVSFKGLLLTQGTSNCNATNSNLDTGCATTADSGLTINNALTTTGLFSTGQNAIPYSTGFNWDQPLQSLQTIGHSATTPTFMDVANFGRCSGTDHCATYDWSILSSYSGELKATNGVFPAAAGQACPIDGSKYLSANGINALVSAVELHGDGAGNDNNLCESNEACLFQPNIGVYQGQGAIYSHSCTFTDGTVTGVTLYGYNTNGAP